MNNLFFEQLVQRIEGDRKAMNQAADLFRGMIDRKVWKKLTLKREIPENLDELEEAFYRQQIFFRQIQLEGKWWTRSSGKLLAFSADDDTPVLLAPGFADYTFVDPETGRRCNARKNMDRLKKEAFSLSYPLPQGELTIRSLIGHALRQLSVYDGICALLACLGVVLLSSNDPSGMGWLSTIWGYGIGVH